MRRTLFGAFPVLVCAALPCRAHDGPPYPILVDEPLAGLTLSIWADPDVGIGTFYFYLDPLRDSEEPTDVRIAVRPADGQLEEAFFDAEPAPKRAPYQMVGEVDFAFRGPWEVRFLLDGPRGRGERALEVDVTPPGLGRIDLLWFLSPFLALAFLWVRVVLKKREHSRS